MGAVAHRVDLNIGLMVSLVHLVHYNRLAFMAWGMLCQMKTKPQKNARKNATGKGIVTLLASTFTMSPWMVLHIVHLVTSTPGIVAIGKETEKEITLCTSSLASMVVICKKLNFC